LHQGKCWDMKTQFMKWQNSHLQICQSIKRKKIIYSKTPFHFSSSHCTIYSECSSATLIPVLHPITKSSVQAHSFSKSVHGRTDVERETSSKRDGGRESKKIKRAREKLKVVDFCIWRQSMVRLNLRRPWPSKRSNSNNNNNSSTFVT
jgi:hypothetical protein